MFRKKRAVKYKYKITFVSASGVEDGSFVHVSWKRGAKSVNHGETESNEASNGNVDWNQTVTINCTLFTSSGSSTGYEPKDLLLSLTTFNVEKKKDIVLGKIVVDLAAFADAKEPQTKYHNVKALKKVDGGPFVLVMTYAAELAGETGDDEPISETDAGGEDVSVGDAEEETGAGEDPFTSEPAVAVEVSTPAKKSKNKRSKPSSSSAGLVTPSKNSSDEKLADVIRERDELRVSLENLKKKKRHGADSDEVDVEALQKQLVALRTDISHKEQELADAREALAQKTAEEERVASEKRDIEVQLSELRKSTKNGTEPGSNAVLITALEARIATLESQRDMLKRDLEEQSERRKGETRALRGRINEIEISLDRATSSSRLKGKSEADMLQQQNSQLSKKWDILTELFDSIAHVRFSASGKPMTTMLINDFMRPDGQSDESTSFIPVTSAIKLALSAPMSDYNTPLLWVSTLLNVLVDLGQSVATVPALETLGSPDSKNVNDTFMRLLVQAFSKALDGVYAVIEPACHDSFIASSTPSSSSVVAVLASVSAVSKNVHLPPSIRKQLMSQIVYDIDATVLNELVKDQSLCTCDRVFKIRQAMTAIESWLLKDSEIAAAKRQFRYIREVANLFAMDKTVLTDEEAVNAAFSALNVSHLARLLEYYHPDDLNGLTVDPNLIRDMKVKALEAADSAPLEADGHRWFNLPK